MVADHVRVLAAVDGLAVPVRGRVPVVGVAVLARSGDGLPARRPAPLVAAPASGTAWTGWPTRAVWANLATRATRSGKAARARIANRAALLPVRRWVAGGCRRTLAGAGLARLAVPSVWPRLPLRVIGGRRSRPAELTRLTLRTIGARRPLHAVRARLALQAELTRPTLRVVRARLAGRAIRARLALRAELARRPLNVKRTRLSLRVKRARLALRAEVSGPTLRVVRARRRLRAVRTRLALGAVRAGLSWPTVTAWPGETAGGGVPRCRRVSGNRAVSWHWPGGSARTRKSSRPESVGCRSTGCRSAGSRSARSGETALARERAGTGKRATSRGTPLTRECAIGGEISRAGEWPLGRVRVLGRGRSVTVRRTVAWSADRGVGGPTGGIGFAALGRDDQAAWRVDGGRGQDPFPIGVNMGRRPGGAIRDVGAGKRTLTLIRGGRARRRTDVPAGPAGTRCQRSRPGRPGRKPSGRDPPGARPVQRSLSGRREVAGRSVLTGRAVLRRAELTARRRLARQNARTELTRLGELPRRGELTRGHRCAVGHPWAGHELPWR